MKRVLLKHNSGHIQFDDTEKQEYNLSLQELKEQSDKGLLRLPRSTMIVGDGVYNNVWHPTSELERASKTFDRQPFNINHSEDVQDEIGFWTNVEYKDDKLSGVPVLNLNTEQGQSALSHIQNRMIAGKPAELSVGFWATIQNKHVDSLDKTMQVASDIEGDHCSLVTRGACSPSNGAGIGLKQTNKNNDISKIEDINMTKENKEEQENTEPVNQSKKDDTMNLEEFRKEIMGEMQTLMENNQADDHKEDSKVSTLEKEINELKETINALKQTKPQPKTLSRDDFLAMEKPKQNKLRSKAGLQYLRYISHADHDPSVLRGISWKGGYE